MALGSGCPDAGAFVSRGTGGGMGGLSQGCDRLLGKSGGRGQAFQPSVAVVPGGTATGCFRAVTVCLLRGKKRTDSPGSGLRAKLSMQGGAADAKGAGGGRDVAISAGEGAHQHGAFGIFEAVRGMLAQKIAQRDRGKRAT